MQYFKYTQPDEPGSKVSFSRYLRDSTGYLVDHNGNIFFATNDFTTAFYGRYLVDRDHVLSPEDTAFKLEQRMGDKDVSVTVPAGQFITLGWKSVYTLNNSLAQMSTKVRTLSTRYSAGVGMVTETLPFYAADPGYRERRLIRYRIN